MGRMDDIGRAIAAYWPVFVLVGVILALEFIFPGVLTQKYFDNIYISSDVGEAVFITFFLAGISGYEKGNRRRLSIFWIWLVIGSFAAAGVADLEFADVLPKFYLTSAIIIEVVGAVLGFVIRPDFLARVGRHIFDPDVSVANRLFRLGLALIPFALALLVAVSLYLGGEWRAALNPHWRDWPLVACVAWGFAAGLLWPKPRPTPVVQLAT